jgi:hypothetical protein
MNERITWIEKIQSMSLDDMAIMLSKMCRIAESCSGCPFDNGDCPCCTMREKWKEWLQKSANADIRRD